MTYPRPFEESEIASVSFLWTLSDATVLWENVDAIDSDFSKADALFVDHVWDELIVFFRLRRSGNEDSLVISYHGCSGGRSESTDKLPPEALAALDAWEKGRQTKPAEQDNPETTNQGKSP